MCAQLTQRKGSPDSCAPAVHRIGDGVGNLAVKACKQVACVTFACIRKQNFAFRKHFIAFGAFKPSCHCDYPLGVACVAYPVEQFTRHIEKDVNIDGTVECLDGASDFLSGAFNSRTRDSIFKDEQCVCDFCVPREFRDGFVVESVPVCP